jgi:hypothetical protein
VLFACVSLQEKLDQVASAFYKITGNSATMTLAQFKASLHTTGQQWASQKDADTEIKTTFHQASGGKDTLTLDQFRNFVS